MTSVNGINRRSQQNFTLKSCNQRHGPSAWWSGCSSPVCKLSLTYNPSAMLLGAHAPISGFTQWLTLCLSPSATEALAALPKHYSLVADAIKYQSIHATALPRLVFKTPSTFPVLISHSGNCSLMSDMGSDWHCPCPNLGIHFLSLHGKAGFTSQASDFSN